MSVDATSSSTAASNIPANPAGYTARVPKQVLDSDDFLSLLSAQMANQDPMEPMKDTAFVAQMASFSSLASMSQMSKDFALLRADQNLSTANSYLGNQVTVKGKDDTLVTGMVTAVDNTYDEPMILVEGQYYSLAQIQRVALPASPTTSGS